MEFAFFTLLNGLAYGLLLFMLSSGLTLIFSMMGVLNFAHASFYMLGAYLSYSITRSIGFWPALVFAPLLVAVAGACVERYGLRRVHQYGHIPELLFTFGLSYVVVELVQLVWGRAPLAANIPAALDGPLFSLYGTSFPTYRAFMMGIAVLMLGLIYLLLSKTRVGMVIHAALSHPEMAQALGHNVPRIFMLVFAGGCGLAGLAGVIGGNIFPTEPAMAASMGSIIFVVVVVGGMGSLAGAFVASLLLGVLQTFAVVLDYSLLSLLAAFNFHPAEGDFAYPLLKLSIANIAPILPYLALVLVLILRPRGLFGKREG